MALEVQAAPRFTGPLVFSPYVTSQQDAFHLLDTKFRRENVGLLFGDNIFFNGVKNTRMFLTTSRYKQALKTISSFESAIDLSNVCSNMWSGDKYSTNLREAFEAIPRCTPEHLSCNSVTRIPLEEESDGDNIILMAITNRGRKRKGYLDIGIVDTCEVEPPKKKVTNALLQSMRKLGSQQGEKNNKLYSIRESNFAQNDVQFIHCGDMFSCERQYLVHCFETSTARISQMEEEKVYVVVISSYEDHTKLPELCCQTPDIFLFNSKLYMMQKINIPLHQIIQNSDDSNCFAIGGIIKKEGRLYFVSPSEFPSFGRTRIPLSDKQSPQVQQSCRDTEEFKKKLHRMFTEYTNNLSEEEEEEMVMVTTTSAESFKRMVIVHRSPAVIRKLASKERSEDGLCLYVLVDNFNVTYFKTMKCLLEFCRDNKHVFNPNNDSSSPCLSVPLGLCFNDVKLTRVNVTDNPFNNWVEAHEQISAMDSIEIFVDGDIVKGDDLIRSGMVRVAAQMIFVCKKSKPASLLASSVLDSVSSIYFWSETSPEPQFHAGFQPIPTGRKRISTKTNTDTKFHEILFGDDDVVPLQDVLRMIKDISLTTDLVTQHVRDYATVVYQISMLCNEGQLRDTLDTMKRDICSILETSKKQLQNKEISQEQYDEIKRSLDTFLRNLTDNSLIKNNECNNAERLAQRRRVANNVAEVTKHGFNPMDIKGESLIFTLNRAVGDHEKIPLALDDNVVLGNETIGYLIDTEVFAQNLANKFICRGFSPSFEPVFVFPLYDDRTSTLKRVDTTDWRALATEDGLPTNLVRIKMRQLIGETIQMGPQTQAVTFQLLELMISAARVVLFQKDTECIRRICRGLFVSIYALLISGNSYISAIPKLFTDDGVDVSKSFLSYRENIAAVLCLQKLLDRSDFEDKQSTSENLKRNILSHVRANYQKSSVQENDIKRDNDTAAGKLLDKLEQVIIRQSFEFINDFDRENVFFGSLNLTSEEHNNNNEEKPSHRKLISYAQWMLRQLKEEYGITGECRVLARDRGHAFVLNYLGGIVDDYYEDKVEKFGLARRHSDSHRVGKLAFLLYYYLRRPKCCDPDIFLYYVKKIVIEAVTENPDWIKEGVVVMKSQQQLNEVYDRLLDDILNNDGYRIDLSGYFVRNSIGQWKSIMKQAFRDCDPIATRHLRIFAHRLSDDQDEKKKDKKKPLKLRFVSQCWNIHRRLTCLLVCMAAAETKLDDDDDDVYLKFAKVVTDLLAQKYPESIPVQLAKETTFDHIFDPTAVEINEFLAKATKMQRAEDVSQRILEFVERIKKNNKPLLSSDDIDLFKKERVGCKDMIRLYCNNLPSGLIELLPQQQKNMMLLSS